MIKRLGQCMRIGLLHAAILVGTIILSVPGFAAPYAAYVMDARSGEVLYQTNADTRLHPASLTKMMTLYICFEAIQNGEISLDTQVKVSAKAANEDPSKLGLRAGQTIALRYLIRAAAVKSANDAATAIGEAIGGSEEAFAKRMNRTAKALGMKNSTFKNANGLTREGHLSTAHDMALLGRHLFYDYPQYYNIFSRRTTDAGMAEVSNTNRRFLDSYEGADGIKTGYTNAAGFNLVASAVRGDKRIIASVFGGTSTAQRNAKMTELLDAGFGQAPGKAPVNKPDAPVYAKGEQAEETVLADAGTDAGQDAGGVGKTLRISGAVKTSPRPKARPGTPAPDADLLVAMQDNIQTVLAAVDADPAAVVASDAKAAFGPMPRPEADTSQQTAKLEALPAAPAPAPEDPPFAVAELPADLPFELVSSPPPDSVPAIAEEPRTAEATLTAAPKPRPEMVMLSAVAPDAALQTESPEVVTRLSTSDGKVWGVTLGKFNSSSEAERLLMKTALAEPGTLSDALRKVNKRKTGFEANFVGMSQDQADLACRRLQARNIQCFTLGP